MQNIDGSRYWVGSLPARIHSAVQYIRQEEPDFAGLDETVLMAIYTGRELKPYLKKFESGSIGINLGSSRGATRLFERYHTEYLGGERIPPQSSPTTTLGNLSSWLAHDLGVDGPAMSHSITCSTGLHSMLNGIAWLRSGMASAVIAGATESPLTGFTLAQMMALKIYSREEEVAEYPCQSLKLDKEANTLVLGEAASLALLTVEPGRSPLARIIGLGYATEPLQHVVSLSADADCLQKSMTRALGNAGLKPGEIDVIAMHAPGTRLGDKSEYLAIRKVFGNECPFLTTHKWKLGHTFATSGMLGIEMACLMLRHQQAITVPFHLPQSPPSRLDRILVNAVGFGGNAVSIVLSRPDL